MTAPKIDGYLSQYSSNDWNSPSLTAETLEALKALFKEFDAIAPNGRNGNRVLYISAERGPIEDFGDYEEMLADELVANRDGVPGAHRVLLRTRKHQGRHGHP